VSGEIRYPTFDQAKGLVERVPKVTGGERDHLSISNLEFVLDAVVKKTAFMIHEVINLHPFVNGKSTAFELTKQILERTDLGSNLVQRRLAPSSLKLRLEGPP